MHKKNLLKKVLGVCFLAIFAISFYILIWQIVTNHNSISTSTGDDLGRFNLFNFYTVQTNIFVMIWTISYGLGLLGVKSLRSLSENPMVRGAISLYIFVTGIVFALILVPVMDSYYGATELPAMNVFVMDWQHYFIPFMMTLIWFIPFNDKVLEFKKCLWWLIYPVLYGVYTLIRGSIIGWYPYPFINPIHLGGWIPVLRNIVFLALFFILLIMIFVQINKFTIKLRRKFIGDNSINFTSK